MTLDAPLAICLVTSGSRGNKLLFYDNGIASKDGSKNVLSELPARTLSEILAPNGLMVNHTFQLNVDQWKFVGHPFSVQHGTFSITFNIVFVVESYSNPGIVKAYDHLSHLLGSAMVHEEEKCGFLQTEVKTLLKHLEEMDIPDPTDGTALKESSLAKSLHEILVSLQSGEMHVHVKINQWTEVSTLLQLNPEEAKTKSDRALVRSYSALLLLVECAEDIVDCLPAACNPAMYRLLRNLSPMKNLQDVSLDADIPLSQVLRFASHLVHWGKAMTIYPLSESNVYIASSTAETRVCSELSEKFSSEFLGFSLPQMLSNFELPMQMTELKERIASEITIQVVVWLLKHKQISQLHTYIYIVPMTSSTPGEGPSTDLTQHQVAGTAEPSTTQEPRLEGEGIEHSLKGDLMQYLSQQEYHCLVDTEAANDYEDLNLFSKLCKYFRGSHHLEEIMVRENIQRSQLLTLVDKFSEILVTCTLPEHYRV